MDKTTIILLIIIILICCSLLIMTGYISFRVYKKPIQPEIIQMIPPQQSSSPTFITQHTPIVSRTDIPPIVLPPMVTKRDIPEYSLNPESIIINLPTPEDLSKQRITSSETIPVPFNQPISKTTPTIMPPARAPGRVSSTPLNISGPSRTLGTRSSTNIGPVRTINPPISSISSGKRRTVSGNSGLSGGM